MAVQYIEAKNVNLTFTPPNRMPVTALQGFDVAVGEGEFVSIVGPSGCGKSTFLNVLLGLIKPNSGEMAINGNPVSGPGRDRRRQQNGIRAGPITLSRLLQQNAPVHKAVLC